MPTTFPFGELLRKASDISKDMMEDLEIFQVIYAMIERYTADDNTNEILREGLTALSQAITEYLTFAAKLLNPEPGKSRGEWLCPFQQQNKSVRILTDSAALQDIRMIIKVELHENERRRLRGVVLREYDAFKQAHAFSVAKQTLALQNEQLKLQRQVAADMRAVLERTSPSPAAKEDGRAPVDTAMPAVVQADVVPGNGSETDSGPEAAERPC